MAGADLNGVSMAFQFDLARLSQPFFGYAHGEAPTIAKYLCRLHCHMLAYVCWLVNANSTPSLIIVFKRVNLRS